LSEDFDSWGLRFVDTGVFEDAGLVDTLPLAVPPMLIPPAFGVVVADLAGVAVFAPLCCWPPEWGEGYDVEGCLAETFDMAMDRSLGG